MNAPYSIRPKHEIERPIRNITAEPGAPKVLHIRVHAWSTAAAGVAVAPAVGITTGDEGHEITENPERWRLVHVGTGMCIPTLVYDERCAYEAQISDGTIIQEAVKRVVDETGITDWSSIDTDEEMAELLRAHLRSALEERYAGLPLYRRFEIVAETASDNSDTGK